MRRFIVGFLATIGTLVLLAIVAGVAFLASGPFSPKPLPQQMVLSLDLRSLPPETTSTGLLSGGLFGSSRDLVETVQLLWQAADDPRVVGLYRRDRRRERRPRPRPGAAPGDRPLPRQGQVRGRLRRVAGRRRQPCRRLLSRGRAGADLAAAERRLRRHRHRRRDTVPQGRPRQARRQGRGRQALRIQERARHASLENGYTGPARENLQQLIDSLFGQFVADVARDRKIEAAQASPA